MDELKLCPFCGGKAVMVEGTQPRNIGRFSAVCGMCFCATAWEINKENAEFVWNRRANDDFCSFGKRKENEKDANCAACWQREYAEGE